VRSASPTGKRSWRRPLSAAVALAVIAVTYAVVLPAIADYGEVWESVSAMSRTEAAALASVTVVYLASFGPAWSAALPGLRHRQAVTVALAGTATANVAPAGAAVSVGISFTMLRGWGFERAPITLAIIVTGVWNQLVNVTLPVVALGLLTLGGERSGALQTLAPIAVLVLGGVVTTFALVLRSDAEAQRVGRAWDRVASAALRFVRRGPVAGSARTFTQFRHDSIGLLRDRWPMITLTTVGAALTAFLVLWVAVRAVGIDTADVTFSECFAAWALARLLGTVPITPGGLGIVDLGLAGALRGFGGPEAEVVAAVLVFRFLTYVPPILLGGVAALTWRRHHPPTDA